MGLFGDILLDVGRNSTISSTKSVFQNAPSPDSEGVKYSCILILDRVFTKTSLCFKLVIWCWINCSELQVPNSRPPAPTWRYKMNLVLFKFRKLETFTKSAEFWKKNWFYRETLVQQVDLGPGSAASSLWAMQDRINSSTIFTQGFRNGTNCAASREIASYE